MKNLSEDTKRAIAAKISLVINELRTRASQIVTNAVQARAAGKGSGLHGALHEIPGEPLKAAEAELIDFYIEVGVRDPEVIAAGIRDAFVPGISNIGNGFVAAHWNASSGGGNRLALDFEARVKGFTAGTMSRALVALAKQRQKDLKDLTYYDQIVRRVKNNKVGAWILLAAVLLGGFTLSATVKEFGLFVWHKVSSAPPASPAPPATGAAPRAPSTDARPDR
jgi:hypothetical protein